MQKHLAFKCNYCDGGEGDLVGFAGTCSINTIKDNIEGSVTRSWCQEPGRPCYEYFQSGFKEKLTEEQPCYDSRLFSTWSFGAGYTRKTGEPKKILSVGKGSIAVFTTVFPKETEQDRRIIGLFRVDNVDNEYETTVYADSVYRLRLPLAISKELFFWDYYVNKDTPKSIAWQSGMFRYLSDSQVARILKDIAEVSPDSDIGNIAATLLGEVWDEEEVPKADGPHVIGENPFTQRVAFAREYPGGEGKDHKRLKEWLGQHPEHLGYSDVVHTEIDVHRYISGDLVDIYWRRKNGMQIVVEVETKYPEPGVHQAIKYRSLTCAESRIPLDSPDVEGWVVAWNIPDNIRELCESYGIRYKEISPEMVQE